MSDELFPIFQRICLRCLRLINGYGFYTLYGSIHVTAPGPTQDGSPLRIRVHACGEPVHHHCPAESAAARAPVHDAGEFGVSAYARHTRNVAPGIDYNARTGRYGARVGKKRLGTHTTPEQAEMARSAYLKAMRSTTRPGRHSRSRHPKKSHDDLRVVSHEG